MLTCAGLSKLTPVSVGVWGCVGVPAGLGRKGVGERLEGAAGEGARPGRTLTAPGIRGAAPGKRLAGLMPRLAWRGTTQLKVTTHQRLTCCVLRKALVLHAGGGPDPFQTASGGNGKLLRKWSRLMGYKKPRLPWCKILPF